MAVKRKEAGSAQGDAHPEQDWKHGVSRVDMVENRFVGMKSRACTETPGGRLFISRTGKSKA